MKDSFERVIDYMRISITDRCNLRCRYCMPEDIAFIPHEEIMTYEELLRLTRLFAGQGIKKIKITGGEPLVRRGCVDFIQSLKEIEGISNVTITTNGVLLEQYMDDLAKAGIDGINISLDTLRADSYEKITGRNEFGRVWRGIVKAIESGIRIKLNCVPVEGVNAEEIPAFFELAKNNPIDVRFIEMMPIGHGREFQAVSAGDILELLRQRYDNIYEIREKKGNGPAVYYENKDFEGSVGIIGAVHKKFCSSCNRIRLTSEGFLKLCLYYKQGIDLKTPMRKGISDQELAEMIRRAIAEKPREHQFFCDIVNTRDTACGGQSGDVEEMKNMSQIGG